MALLAQATYTVKRAAKDGYSVSLSPESIVLTKNSSGVVSDLSTAKTKVSLTVGGNGVTPVIGTLVVSGCAATKSGMDITMTSVLASSGYVDIPVTYKNFSATKRFVFTTVMVDPVTIKKEVQSQLAVESELIVAEVTATTKVYVNGKMDELTIGGRNLIKLSSIPGTTVVGKYNDNTGKSYSATSGQNYRIQRFTQSDIGFYSLGFWIQSSVANTVVVVDVCDSNMKSITLTAASTWYWFANEGMNVTSGYLASPYYGFIDLNPNQVCTLTICNLKIERGTKCTTYSPAPEDVDASISNVQTQVASAVSRLTIAETSIKTLVSQTTTIGNTVASHSTAITQLPTSIDARITTQVADGGIIKTKVESWFTLSGNTLSMGAKQINISGATIFGSISTKTEAQGYATTARTEAITTAATDATAKSNSAITAARNNLATSLGYADYSAMEAQAIAGNTIINGGMIRTSLIDADAIITTELLARKIAATNITTQRLTVSEGCTVGGFEIGNNRIGISASPDNIGSKGMFLYPHMIGFNGSNMQAIIGTYSNFGSNRLGQFVNTTSDYLPNVGLVFDVRNVNNGNRNYAFLGNGNGVLNGYMFGYGFKEYSFAANNQYTVLGTLVSEIVYVYFNHSNCAIVLPTLASMCNTLGISYSTPFSAKITVINTGGDGTLFGRATSGISGISGYQYPKLIDWNGSVNNDGWWISNGDSFQLCLYHYDDPGSGSTPASEWAYRAYIVNRQN